MKKLVLFAAAAVLGFSACQKNESAADNNLPVKQKLNDKLVVKNGEDWGIHRTWVPYDPKNPDKSGDCFPPAIECYDDIIVTPDGGSSFHRFIGAVRLGDFVAISTFAKENFNSLSEIIVERDLNGVIHGELLPAIKDKDAGKTFLFFKETTSGKLVSTYPVVIN